MKIKKQAKTILASRPKTSQISGSQWHVNKQIMLDVDNLDYGANGQVILEDISFCIHRGEFIGLIGPNGAGKTTLLRIILGLLKPSAGKMDWKESKSIGYIPQRGYARANQVPVSVLEVVKLGARGNKQKALESLGDSGMADYAGRRFDELSGGQQQRVLIAKALASDSRLLVLDEPTTGIDETSEREFYKLISALNGRGITILMVSHDIDAILATVTRVICLNRTVRYDGPVEHFKPDDYLHAFTTEHRLLHHQHEGAH